MRRATILVLAVLVLGPGSRLAADEDSAAYFTSRGRKALEAGRLDEAAGHFQKALGEAAEFPDAMLGLAEVALARGEKAEAARRLEACLMRCRRGLPVQGVYEVRTRAEELLRKVERPRLEYCLLREEYADRLLSLAQRSEEKAPDLSRRCVDRILKICPDRAEALELRKRLGGGAAPAEAAAAAPPGKGEPLFNGRDLEGWVGLGLTWQVKDGILTGRASENAYLLRKNRQLEGDYTVEYELRFVKDLGKDPMVSLIFGMTGEHEKWNVLMFKQRCYLEHDHGGADRQVRVGKREFFQISGGFDPSAWNRIRVQVRGRKLTCFANGKELFGYASPEEGAFDGMVALVVQDCHFELRRLALLP
jgi:tetratricopeptide (TPR) repeat protein